MDRGLLKALYLILMSLGLALLFNFLFFGKAIGVSAFIFTAVLLMAVFLFGKYQKISFQKSWWLIILIGFFALMPSIRESDFLTFLNVCAALGLLMLLAHQLAGTPAFVMKIIDYFALVFVVPFRMLIRAIATLLMIGQVHSSVKNREIWLRIIKGVVMALPILIILGLLFSMADLAFSEFVNNIITIDISEHTAQYVALLIFAFVAGLSFLSYIYFPKQTIQTLPEKTDDVVRSNKRIEVIVFLGLISALFLVFIIFQITYLFGGENNIINAGFTYAEYARRGFWELLAVAMLSLLVLLASEKYAGAESKKDNHFTIPALILIAEVVIVIISAFKRLSLYIDTYGMTELRFYVAGFIILLLALFILLGVKFIKSKQENFFAFGTLISVIAFLVIVNAINPDSFIIKSNIKQYNRTGKIDASYIGILSADAEAGKIEVYGKLQGDDKMILGSYLLNQQEILQDSSKHWQSANVSRSKALTLLQQLESK